jgi:ribosomal-protein-alanine N-acetyltransferase
LKIRDFDAGDLQSVQKLLSSTPEAAQWPADEFPFQRDRGFLIRVAEEEHAVCGLVVFRIMADEAEILNLAVDSRQRRRGMGSRLLADAIAACKAAGVKKIFLEVRDSNEAARNFYLRMGFNEAGIRQQYYREPMEDALVLCRTVE